MLYLLDQMHLSPAAVMDIPWSRRKRLVNEHSELVMVRNRKQEEAARNARRKR